MPDVNDHMVSGILDWVTLLELSMGPVTITLFPAAFKEEDDNISFTLFDEWKTTDLKLEGMAAADCRAFGNRDVGVSVVVDIANRPGDDDAFVKVATCRTREKSRNPALWTGTDQDVCSYDCASTAMKEFDVWHLAVANMGFLRLVVYPEADTGFVKKSTASGMRWSVKVSRSKRMRAQRRRVVCFRDPAETVSVVRKEDALSPRQFHRPDQPKLPDGRSNVANVLERPRLKGPTSIPIPNDTSTTCRISWCGGVERKMKSRRTRGQLFC